MLDTLYENIGGKIKNWAKWIFIVEAIGAIITGLVLLCTDEDLILYGLITLVCGPIVAYIGSWILFAFGELVEDVHAIRNKDGNAIIEKNEQYNESSKNVDIEHKQNVKYEVEEESEYENESDEFECLNCKKTFTVLASEDTVSCPYCNTKYKVC